MIQNLKRTLFTAPVVTVLALVGCGGDDGDKPAAGAGNQQPAEVIAAVPRGGAEIWASCATCHGDLGEGKQDLKAPSLVNQDSWYLKRQLLNFKSGIRGAAKGDVQGARMAAIAEGLPDDAAIDAVISHIDTLPDVQPATTIEGEPAKGRDYYDMICGACHGPGAEGNVLLNAPRLAGTDDWYLVQQYNNFARGLRGSHVDDKYGRQMQMMSQALPDETVIDNVIAYIQSVGAAVK